METNHGNIIPAIEHDAATAKMLERQAEEAAAAQPKPVRPPLAERLAGLRHAEAAHREAQDKLTTATAERDREAVALREAQAALDAARFPGPGVSIDAGAKAIVRAQDAVRLAEARAQVAHARWRHAQDAAGAAGQTWLRTRLAAQGYRDTERPPWYWSREAALMELVAGEGFEPSTFGL